MRRRSRASTSPAPTTTTLGEKRSTARALGEMELAAGACPGPFEIVGNLVESIREHVRNCPHCRARLAEILAEKSRLNLILLTRWLGPFCQSCGRPSQRPYCSGCLSRVLAGDRHGR